MIKTVGRSNSKSSLTNDAFNGSAEFSPPSHSNAAKLPFISSTGERKKY